MKAKEFIWTESGLRKPTCVRSPVRIPTRPVRFIDMPGIQSLEDLFVIYGRRNEVPHICDAPLERVLKTYFGIVEFDTRCDVPEEFALVEEDDLPDHIRDIVLKHERQFETQWLDIFELVDFFKAYNLDFTDARGEPLRCLPHIARCVEAACKGLAGSIPDLDAIMAKARASKLEKEVEVFQARKVARR